MTPVMIARRASAPPYRRRRARRLRREKVTGACTGDFRGFTTRRRATEPTRPDAKILDLTSAGPPLARLAAGRTRRSRDGVRPERGFTTISATSATGHGTAVPVQGSAPSTPCERDAVRRRVFKYVAGGGRSRRTHSRSYFRALLDQVHLRLSFPKQDVGLAHLSAGAHGVQEVVRLRAAHGGHQGRVLPDAAAQQRRTPAPSARASPPSPESRSRGRRTRAAVLHELGQQLGDERERDLGGEPGLGHGGGEDNERVASGAQIRQRFRVRDVALDQLRGKVAERLPELVRGLARAHQAQGGAKDAPRRGA